MIVRTLFLAAWLGVLAALSWPLPAHAYGATAGQPIPVCVARATPGLTAAKVLRDGPAGFDCNSRQSDLGSGDYWVVSRSMPPGLVGERAYYLRVSSAWQDAMTLYALYADGSFDRVRIDDHGASRRLQLGTVVQQSLKRHSGPPIRLAWFVEGAANPLGIIISPHIATASERTAANLSLAVLYSAFGGLVFALLFHNAAMWRVLRYRFQLWFLATLGFVSIYALGASGALAWWLPALSNTDRMRIVYATLAMTAAATIQFSTHFFEPRVYEGWLRRLSQVIIGILLGTTAAVLAAPIAWMRVLDRLYSISFLLLVALLFPIVYRAWRERSRFLVPWLLLWVAPCALCALRVAQNFHLIEYRSWVENSTLIAATMEAIGINLAIAYRVRLLARERDEARAQELAARLLADTDPLTGLFNRRAFLGGAIGRTEPHTLLLIDLDRFKSVNDTVGHDGGDEVLRRVAGVLRDFCPPDGLVTRLGGEEFALLAPVGAAPLADIILARLRETSMPFDLTITASIGGCTGSIESERDWKTLYRTADQALFAAKDAGRDRARVIPALAA